MLKAQNGCLMSCTHLHLARVHGGLGQLVVKSDLLVRGVQLGLGHLVVKGGLLLRVDNRELVEGSLQEDRGPETKHVVHATWRRPIASAQLSRVVHGACHVSLHTFYLTATQPAQRPIHRPTE